MRRGIIAAALVALLAACGEPKVAENNARAFLEEVYGPAVACGAHIFCDPRSNDDWIYCVVTELPGRPARPLELRCDGAAARPMRGCLMKSRWISGREPPAYCPLERVP